MKKICYLLLVFNLTLSAQNTAGIAADKDIHISRKGVYQITYSKADWRLNTSSQSDWDAEFNDRFNLLTAYLLEYDFYIPEKQLKKRSKSNLPNMES